MTQTYSVRLPDISERMLSIHAREGQQKDEMCGPYWAAVAVMALTGRAVTQDEAALAAGTRITVGGGRQEDLPPGASSRTDYRQPIPTTANTQLAGTSAAGVVRAISRISDAAVVGVPVRGPWSQDTVGALTDLVLETEALAILNVETRYLWNSHLGLRDMAAYLRGAPVEVQPSEWSVGHYVAVVGSITSSRQLVVCADTYPSLGANGIHVQPPDRLARALMRPASDTSGGAIVAVAAPHAIRVQEWADAAGCEIGFWDNGAAEDTETIQEIL